MPTKWTNEQKRVIEERGNNLLVSAAAGSGKTAVLTERIISLITDSQAPVDIDRMLVLTFTEAAAAEMKDRIGAALRGLLEQYPEDERLRRQSVYLDHAHISTIHSFCSYVIRNYFHCTGIDPALRVMDEAESVILMEDTAKELLEEKYEAADPAFVSFMQTFFTEKKADRNLIELLKKTAAFAGAAPWPAEWLEKAAERWENGPDAPDAFLLLEKMTARADEEVKTAFLQTGELLRKSCEEGGPSAYIPALESDIAMYRAYLDAEDFDGKKAAADAFSFAKFSSSKKKEEDPDLRAEVRKARDALKKEITAVKEEVFSSGLGAIAEEMRYCAPFVRTFCSLTEELMARYQAVKQQRGVMDYSDMEHYALDILVSRQDGQTVRTDAAKELASFFSTVMTDEYQDSNAIQDLILWSVSGEEDGVYDRFMVGDIKQAIYGFRHARPEIFLEKYRTYGEGAKGSVRIDLNRNFRSRKTILDTVNFLFEKLMTPDVGGIRYDENAALVYGDQYENTGEDPVCDILLADKHDPGIEEDPDSDKVLAAEAMMTARHIKRLMKTLQVRDADTKEMRPMRYSDCAILMRSVSSAAEVYIRILTDEGIPAYSAQRTGYFSASEVNTVLDYLRVLDNPIQDIPLTAVLFSPIGKLTAQDLALIRCSGKGSFSRLCSEYARTGENEKVREKLAAFYQTLSMFREKMIIMPVRRLIGEILETTGFGVFAAAMPGGEQRAANLEMLMEKAGEYEKTGFHGLFHFIRYIEQMQEKGIDYGEASLFAKGTDAVAVTSIHKSKGLEYPVVFVCGCARSFFKKDLNASVLLNYEFGIGVDAVNVPEHKKKRTFYKKAVRQALENELYGEELRILYVALTRAREKLVITGVKDLESAVSRCLSLRERWRDQVPGTDLLKADSYMDWIFMALCSDDCFLPVYKWAGLPNTGTQTSCGTVRIMIESTEAYKSSLEKERRAEASKQMELPAARDAGSFDPDLAGTLSEIAGFSYPYEQIADIPAKMSVSDLKKLAYESGNGEEGETLVKEKEVFPYIPYFIKEKKAGLSAADRGTAFHRLLEHLDLRSLGTETPDHEAALRLAKETVEHLTEKGLFTEEEKESIDPEKCAAFILSDIGERMRLADCRGELKRESPFTMSVAAEKVRPGCGSTETVLIQGVIDAWFTEGDNCILVDYKTDRVFGADKLIERYQTQLDYYAIALERSTRLSVTEKIIYSVALDCAISL